MKPFVALALCLGLLAAGQPTGAAGSADDALTELSTHYYTEQWQVEPLQATRVGVHLYDDKLGSYTAAAYGVRAARAQRYLAQLDAIDAASLTPEARFDQQIWRARLVAQAESADASARWRHDPSTYSSIAAGAILSLIQRDFAPLSDRMKSAIARERAIPTMLRDGAANITTVDATTATIAAANIVGASGFFGLVPAAFASVPDTALQRQLAVANAAVIAALTNFREQMMAGPLAHPTGTFAIGADRFAHRLALQELSPISLADYERVGIAALAQTKAQFVATAHAIDPTKSPEAVAVDLGKDHPTADQLLPQAQRDLDALRAFVGDHHLVTLPPDWDVKVIATPTFERQTTFASMDPPGPLETVATQAYYRITPVEPEWSDQRKEEHLAFFNNPYRPIISAHEVMPGHYLNFAVASHERLSLIRKLNWSPSFVEGWAHYDEQMMVDEGWGNGDPRVRLGQLQGALLREARFLVGLREHTQGMSVDDATQFFMTNAFMGREPAHREALRGTQDPLYGYYTLGKLEILKLRADYQARVGTAYTIGAFHDALLAHGSPPVSVLRKELLGASDTGALL